MTIIVPEIWCAVTTTAFLTLVGQWARQPFMTAVRKVSKMRPELVLVIIFLPWS